MKGKVKTMNNNLVKTLSTLPFWIPFPFVFLAVDYYLNDEQSWIAIAAAALLGVLSFTYVATDKIKEMIAGDSIGFLISCITTSFLNDGWDESFFKPLTSISYLHVLILGVIIIQLFAVVTVKIRKKIKSKMKNEHNKENEQ